MPYVNSKITGKDETPERRAGRRLPHTLAKLNREEMCLNS